MQTYEHVVERTRLHVAGARPRWRHGKIQRAPSFLAVRSPRLAACANETRYGGKAVGGSMSESDPSATTTVAPASTTTSEPAATTTAGPATTTTAPATT